MSNTARNSLETLEYNYLDQKANPNTFYRLKIVDLDETFDYSKSILYFDRNCGDNIEIKTIYPNPVNEELHINLTSLNQQPVILKVYDVRGKYIISADRSITKGSNIIILDPVLLEEIYFLHIIDNAGSSVTKTIRFVKH